MHSPIACTLSAHHSLPLTVILSTFSLSLSHTLSLSPSLTHERPTSKPAQVTKNFFFICQSTDVTDEESNSNVNFHQSLTDDDEVGKTRSQRSARSKADLRRLSIVLYPAFEI